MTTLYFASYRETQNHGSGKKIAIATSKPDETKIDGAFKPFVPLQEITDEYRRLQLEDQKKASDFFVSNYKKQLDDFFYEIKESATKQEKTVQDILPFQDGDTFLTWERYGYTSIRPMLSSYLEKEGYKIILR